MPALELLPLTPLDLLARAQRGFPDRVGVIDGEERWTYGAFAERCDRLGHALQRDLDLEPGQVVAWLGGNTHELLEAYYGVLLAGGVLLGRLAAHGADARSSAVRAATVLLLPAGLCLLAVGILDSSLYANAQAETGVQIVALAALLLTSTLRRGADDRELGALQAASVLPTASLVLITFATGLGLALATRPADLVAAPANGGVRLLPNSEPFAVGQPLHCAGILQLEPAQAQAALLKLGYRVSWRHIINDGTYVELLRDPPPGTIIVDEPPLVGTEGQILMPIAVPGMRGTRPAAVPDDCPRFDPNLTPPPPVPAAS